MALFSLPQYPGAVGYNIQFADPLSGDPNAQNPLGPWTNLGTGTVTSPSNIIDAAGDQNLRMYRAAPVVSINGTSVTYPYYQPFSVAMSDPGVYQFNLYDPQITGLLPMFRQFIGDNGIQQTASTEVNLDSGAGTGLLQPDGTTTIFNLADVPDATPAIVLENSVKVVQNGKTKLLGVDYYVVWDAGQVVFATAPLAADTLTITYKEVQYTNRVLNAALSNSVERLGSVGVSGYGVSYDNNVCLLSGPLGDVGLRYIVFYMAQKILNHALIWAKAASARAYKTGDFQMDTAPSRILDGMSNQTQVEFSEIQSAVYKYNRQTTHPYSYGDFDSFFDINGLLPSISAVWLLSPYNAWV